MHKVTTELSLETSPMKPSFQPNPEILPPELFFRILDKLYQSDADPTCQLSLTLLNLSQTSKFMYGLVNNWVVHNVGFQNTIDRIRQLEKEETIPAGPRTPLSIVCRRAGKICALCGNRARVDETFTGIQVCDLCDDFAFPKIVGRELQSDFRLTDLGQQNKRYSKLPHWPKSQLLPPTGSFAFLNFGAHRTDTRKYRWKDVEAAINEGYLLANPSCRRGVEEAPIEELYYVRYHNRKIFCIASDDFWDCFFGYCDGLFESPYKIDMVLFWEFRYRYDPNWRPYNTIEEETREYIPALLSWAKEELWEKRPWATNNFPMQPKCYITEPHANNQLQSRSYERVAEYQSECRLLRRLLKRHPGILSNPSLWLQLHSKRQMEVAVLPSDGEVQTDSPQTQVGHFSLVHSRPSWSVKFAVGTWCPKRSFYGEKPRVNRDVVLYDANLANGIDSIRIVSYRQNGAVVENTLSSMFKMN